MNIYKAIQQDNGDILLEKITLDDTNYKIINKDNGNVLMKKITSINITSFNELKNYDFKKSTIVSCKVNDNVIEKLKYKTVLEHVYGLINDGSKIIKNTKLNIKTVKKQDDGFYYLDDIGISIQGVESNKCLCEIVNQCIENEISIVMKIKLSNCLTLNLDF